MNPLDPHRSEPPEERRHERAFWRTVLKVTLIAIAVIVLIVVLLIGFVLYSCSRH